MGDPRITRGDQLKIAGINMIRRVFPCAPAVSLH